MRRFHQVLLIISVLVASWMGIQAVHEFGHVLGAWITGGKVSKVVWHPLTISRTDLSDNPNPLFVVWAGPVVGVLMPLASWGLAVALRGPGTFVNRFFAGFCLITNGAYIAFSLWLFGAITMPIGLWIWHRQGEHFGLGPAKGQVSRGAAYRCLAASIILVVIALTFGGE